RIRGASPLSVDKVRDELTEILWSHKDIPLDHLDNVTGLCCIDGDSWKRDQRWDRVYSFYDPSDGLIKIRADQFSNQKRFEVAFLVALGQALLGNYSAEKKVLALGPGQEHLGKVYHLRLRDEQERKCFFDNERLREYLQLSRMVADPDDSSHFTRLVNGEEGFTPPGLLMGLIYAWYLDNNLASHIEYKMAVMKVAHSDLIPEQVNVLDRRKRLVNFFREVVFRL
ncbi:MAG: YvcK family protein, partial [Thermodesulfobacteriota bacterium]